MQATKFSADNAGLHVVIYPGDNKILIAMSLADSSINDTDKNLAGFAIWRKYEGKAEEILANRIGFETGVNNKTTAETRVWTGSDQAPFQKFRWVDIPPDGTDKQATYRVCAMYFTGQGKAITKGAEANGAGVGAAILERAFVGHGPRRTTLIFSARCGLSRLHSRGWAAALVIKRESPRRAE